MEQVERAAFDAQRNFGDKAFRSACYAPFTSLNFTPVGDVQVCCKNETYVLGNVGRQSIGEIWNGATLAHLRKALNDYRFDLGCEICEWGIVSGDFRGSNAASFEEYAVESADPEWPQTMGFAVSNNCNFECIMCGGELSSSIRAHRDGLPPMRKVYGDAFFEDLRPYLRRLRQAIFYGGEPFLTPECFRIWDMMLEDGLTPHCHVTTNASQYNAKVERILDAIPFSLSLSVDGASRETVEKIRINVNFEEYSRNIRRFREHARQHGRHLNLSFCLMQQNWHEFGDVLLLADSLECTVFVNTVVGPDHCSLYSLPGAELGRVVDELERQGAQLEDKLTINRGLWKNQLAYLRRNAVEKASEPLIQIRGAILASPPNEESYMYSLRAAERLASEGRWHEALAETLKVDESNIWYYYSLLARAHIRRSMGDVDGAEAELERAMEYCRKPREALVARGWLRYGVGRIEESLQDALRLRELCGTNDQYKIERFTALLQCALIRTRMGDTAAADTDLEDAFELSRRSGDSRFCDAWKRFYRKQPRPAGAVEELLEVLLDVYEATGRTADAAILREQIPVGAHSLDQ